MIAEIFVEKLWKSKSIHLAKRSSLPCQWRQKKKAGLNNKMKPVLANMRARVAHKPEQLCYQNY